MRQTFRLKNPLVFLSNNLFRLAGSDPFATLVEIDRSFQDMPNIPQAL